jgi:hypothetical protein
MRTDCDAIETLDERDGPMLNELRNNEEWREVDVDNGEVDVFEGLLVSLLSG